MSAPHPPLPVGRAARRLPQGDDAEAPTRHTKNRSEERFSPTPRSRIRRTTPGEINLLLNLERSTHATYLRRVALRRKTLTYVGSR